jgi:hypothetical protein
MEQWLMVRKGNALLGDVGSVEDLERIALVLALYSPQKTKKKENKINDLLESVETNDDIDRE